jgi:hypothetical protein
MYHAHHINCPLLSHDTGMLYGVRSTALGFHEISFQGRTRFEYARQYTVPWTIYASVFSILDTKAGATMFRSHVYYNAWAPRCLASGDDVSRSPYQLPIAYTLLILRTVFVAPALVSKIENTLAYMVQGTVVFEISYTTILLLKVSSFR